MKPDWKDAPDWAQWVARDESGRWYWYQDEPVKEHDHHCDETRYVLMMRPATTQLPKILSPVERMRLTDPMSAREFV